MDDPALAVDFPLEPKLLDRPLKLLEPPLTDRLEVLGLPLRDLAVLDSVPFEALATAFVPGPSVRALASTPLGDAVAVALAVLEPELENELAELVNPVPVTFPLMLTLALAVAPGVLVLVETFVCASRGKLLMESARKAIVAVIETRICSHSSGMNFQTDYLTQYACVGFCNIIG